MTTGNNNPTEVLQTLDRELDHEISLVLYGRAALCLGFENAPAQFGTTQDVDAIIRFSQLPGLMKDEMFWDALERANLALEPKGLYLTHLFSEDQVFLRPDWEQHIARIRRPETKFLKLFRPHVVDLILTKMMRGNDDQDMEDVEFLARQGRITTVQIEAAFACIRIPDVPELLEAFSRALPTVRRIIKESEHSQAPTEWREAGGTLPPFDL